MVCSKVQMVRRKVQMIRSFLRMILERKSEGSCAGSEFKRIVPAFAKAMAGESGF